ncbi:protein translocase subunit SecF [Candidatus Nomurabacteria bacterium]|nr:protein translocase subunit SecF [Candidatus Nomurabacteria bacterium]
MNIAKNLKYFFILPALLSILSIAALFMWGLKPGIDLAGGSLLEVNYPDGRPTQAEVQEVVEPLGLGHIVVQPTGSNGHILRLRDITPKEKESLVQVLGTDRTVTEEEFTSIGPSIGAELMQKGWIAIALVSLLTVLFIAFAFRHASTPSSWKYGVVAIVTLLHDILIPAGLFALLGHLYGAEVDALFIVALLTVLGISINDTIVIFDRIRENLKLNEQHHKHEDFESVVGRSISQTISRSINTSITVIIVLLSLYFLGPAATKDFALVLTVGMIAGTYSSIFLASPLLVVWEKFSARKK